MEFFNRAQSATLGRLCDGLGREVKEAEIPNPMAPVLSAVEAYKKKQLDIKLIVQSMHNQPEKHPKRVLRLNKLAIELSDDLKAIGKLITDMKVWTIGGEL